MDLEKSILIVDDFEFARRICKNALKEIGMTNVTEASSGAAAMDALSKQTHDLILTDYNMPGINGIEMVRKIKANEAIKDIPIIMITSDCTKSVLLEATEAGVQGFLNKPFTKEELSEKIERVLS